MNVLYFLKNFQTGPVYLIQFKFRQLEIPPNYNANHLGTYYYFSHGDIWIMY